MNFKTIVEDTTLSVTVNGTIKSIEDSLQFQMLIENACTQDCIKKITISIEESYTITSSIIGFLIRLIKQDNIEIFLVARHQELVNLLHKLNLDQLFHIELHSSPK